MSRRLYLFDIDGTLVATGGAGSGAMRAAFTAGWGLADGFSGIEVSRRTDRANPRDPPAPPRPGAMRAAFTAVWGLADGFSGIEFSGRTDRAILRDALVAAGLDNGAFAADLRRFKRAYFRRLPRMLEASRGRVLPGVEPLLASLAAHPPGDPSG